MKTLSPVAKLKRPAKKKPERAIAVVEALVPSGTGFDPLDNQRHEIFAQKIASGMSTREAYGLAFNNTPECLRQQVWRLVNRPEVRERIRTLQGLSATDVVMTQQERREFCADVVRTPVGEIDSMHPLCQELVITTTKDGGSTRIKTPDKLAALKLDAQLAGELEPDGAPGRGDSAAAAAAFMGDITKLIAGVIGSMREKQADAIEV